MKKHYLLIILIAVTLPAAVEGQVQNPRKRDSLLNLLKHHVKDDTVKVNLLC